MLHQRLSQKLTLASLVTCFLQLWFPQARVQQSLKGGQGHSSAPARQACRSHALSILRDPRSHLSLQNINITISTCDSWVDGHNGCRSGAASPCERARARGAQAALRTVEQELVSRITAQAVFERMLSSRVVLLVLVFTEQTFGTGWSTCPLVQAPCVYGYHNNGQSGPTHTPAVLGLSGEQQRPNPEHPIRPMRLLVSGALPPLTPWCKRPPLTLPLERSKLRNHTVRACPFGFAFDTCDCGLTENRSSKFATRTAPTLFRRSANQIYLHNHFQGLTELSYPSTIPLRDRECELRRFEPRCRPGAPAPATSLPKSVPLHAIMTK